MLNGQTLAAAYLKYLALPVAFLNGMAFIVAVRMSHVYTAAFALLYAFGVPAVVKWFSGIPKQRS